MIVGAFMKITTASLFKLVDFDLREIQQPISDKHIFDANYVISEVDLIFEIPIFEESTCNLQPSPAQLCAIIGLNRDAASKKVIITTVRVIRMNPASDLELEILVC